MSFFNGFISRFKSNKLFPNKEGLISAGLFLGARSGPFGRLAARMRVVGGFGGLFGIVHRHQMWRLTSYARETGE